jgi:hypothetical protein
MHNFRTNSECEEVRQPNLSRKKKKKKKNNNNQNKNNNNKSVIRRVEI